MPKFGMEPIRKKALIEATISEIGAAGTLDIPVSQIAKRAGMSAALAHHYFGSKEQIFLAAMRHILKLYGTGVRAHLSRATTPLERIHGIIAASFNEDQFERDVVAAWLTFYVRSLQSEEASRLLNIYARRLHSNLYFNLRQIFDEREAEQVTQGLASLIDGFYIRHALQDFTPNAGQIKALVSDYVTLWMTRAKSNKK